MSKRQYQTEDRGFVCEGGIRQYQIEALGAFLSETSAASWVGTPGAASLVLTGKVPTFANFAGKASAASLGLAGAVPILSLPKSTTKKLQFQSEQRRYVCLNPNKQFQTEFPVFLSPIPPAAYPGTPSGAALKLNGQLPTLAISGNFQQPVGAAGQIKLNGTQPSLIRAGNFSGSAATGSIFLTGQQPNLSHGVSFRGVPSPEDLVVNGNVLTISQQTPSSGNFSGNPITSVITLTGQTPTYIGGNKFVGSPTPASMVLAGGSVQFASFFGVAAPAVLNFGGAIPLFGKKSIQNLLPQVVFGIRF